MIFKPDMRFEVKLNIQRIAINPYPFQAQFGELQATYLQVMCDEKDGNPCS